MKHYTRNLLKPILSALLFSQTLIATAYSEEQESDFQWFASLGVFVGSNEKIYIDRNLEANEFSEGFRSIDLGLRAQYKGFFLEIPGRGGEPEGLYVGPGLGYNFYNTENWSLDAYYTVEQGTIEWGFANPEQELFIRKHADVRLGLRASGYYQNLLTQFVFAPVSMHEDIGGYSFSASIRRDWQIRNWNFYVSLGAKYSTADIWDYYYGISEEEATQISNINSYFETSELLDEYYTATDIDAGVSATIQLGFEYPFTQNWVVGWYYSALMLPESVKRSPYRAGNNTAVAVGLSIAYVF